LQKITTLTQSAQNIIKDCFLKWKNKFPNKIVALPHSGSNRQYFRIFEENNTIIGVYNNNSKENRAFLSFTEHFGSFKINVPTILRTFIEKNVYFINDLGNTNVLDWLNRNRKNNNFSDNALELYKNIITQLIKIQIDAGKTIDYSLSYPDSDFNRESILFDLNYFKNEFLRKTNIDFNEVTLEKDFNFFADYLLQTNCSYFMYRDFQARNIMLYNSYPYFIDYQGGRKGALQYDLASLLYQAKANIPEHTRTHLLNYYIDNVKKTIDIDKIGFKKHYYAYALIRVLQTLGAYGYRGLFEKKQHFIDSIPYAINNLSNLKNKITFSENIPELSNIIDILISNKFDYEQ